MLSHPLRRRIVVELAEQGDSVSLEALAEALARADEPDVDERQGEPTTVEAVETSLHHQHIPKLADVGWIDYDDQERTIRPQSHADLIRTDLQDASDELASIRAAFDE